MLLNALKTFLGLIIIPKNIINDDPKILHISDTPSFIYSEIVRIIKIIDPQYIIHTGDVADDVKLELYSWKKDMYQNNIKKFSNKLNKATSNTPIFCVGNHDDKDTLIKYFGEENVFSEPTTMNICGKKFSFSHYIEKIDDLDSDFYLFGHNKKRLSSVTNGKFYLNGIQGINIINLKTLTITSLNYPLGTDDSRQQKKKMGL